MCPGITQRRKVWVKLALLLKVLLLSHPEAQADHKPRRHSSAPTTHRAWRNSSSTLL